MYITKEQYLENKDQFLKYHWVAQVENGYMLFDDYDNYITWLEQN